MFIDSYLYRLYIITLIVILVGFRGVRLGVVSGCAFGFCVKFGDFPFAVICVRIGVDII